MKIATLNTWKQDGPFKERWQFLIAELARLDPDILCLQEVFEPTLFEKIKMETPLLCGIAHHNAGLATLSKLPIVSSEVLKYKTVSQLENETRSVLLATLQIGQETIPIANTHLSWRSEDGPVRLGQTRELIEAMHKLKQPGLLAGDFNDMPKGDPIKEIKKAGYVDVYDLCNEAAEGITWDNQNPFIQGHSVKFSDRRIDFLFMHKNLLSAFKVQHCEIIFKQPNEKGIYVSDHYGVLTEINLRSGNLSS